MEAQAPGCFRKGPVGILLTGCCRLPGRQSSARAVPVCVGGSTHQCHEQAARGASDRPAGQTGQQQCWGAAPCHGLVHRDPSGCQLGQDCLANLWMGVIPPHLHRAGRDAAVHVIVREQLRSSFPVLPTQCPPSCSQDNSLEKALYMKSLALSASARCERQMIAASIPICSVSRPHYKILSASTTVPLYSLACSAVAKAAVARTPGVRSGFQCADSTGSARLGS